MKSLYNVFMKTFTYIFSDTIACDLAPFCDEKNILVQIFCGEGRAVLEKAVHSVMRQLPHAICIGTTTDGEINNNAVSTYKTIISLSTFECTTLKTAYETNSDAFLCGKNLATTLLTPSTKLLILFTDGTSINAEEFLKGVESCDATIPICGGMAGDNGAFLKTFISSQNTLLEKGVVGVSLNSQCLDVSTDFKFDWKTIGLEHTIEKVEGNRIYQIDDLTPVAFYQKYLGSQISQTEFPLIIEKNGIARARAVISQNDDGSVRCSGNFAKGDKVKIGFGDAKSLLMNPTKAMSRLNLRDAQTFFIYSCMARRRYIPDLIHLETQPFADIAPSVGFFTYSEFFHEGNRNELLNQSLSVVALSEKKVTNTQNTECTFNAESLTDESSYAKTIQSLSNLVQQSNRDYEEQSKKLEEQITYSRNLLASHRQFLRYTVHEMNTLLSVIMNNIELHEMEFGKSRYLENIEVGLKSIFSLYDDLSYLVKKDHLPSLKRTIDLVDYLRSRIDFFTQVVYKAKSHFIFESNVPQAHIFFNETKLQRIIDNNLTNAIKYTYENSPICITLHVSQSMCTFSITSHSRKIQEPKKVFEEYYREDSLRYGFGLGLTLVKTICDEEGIAIELDSDEEKTIFSYEFPMDTQ